jgi:rhamnogalacturonyl hydrolase YesR
MGLSLYVKAAPRFRAKEIQAYDDDAVMQLVVADSCTYDETTDLWKHGWDESRTLFWADAKTGRSQHSWGRAMGWNAMALIEVLDELPQKYIGRDTLISVFKHIMSSVVNYQDQESGVWHNVLDVTDSRNYLEATCSAMFTYCLLKGVRLGYLDNTFLEHGLKAYRGLVDQFVEKNSDGTLSLTNCCSAAGLGPEDNTTRDGSFEYYISEPIVDNDPKGIGPFIWASLEMERLGYTVDKITSIRNIILSEKPQTNTIYSITGTRTKKLDSTLSPNGIYIINGRKVVKK